MLENITEIAELVVIVSLVIQSFLFNKRIKELEAKTKKGEENG